MPEFHKKPVTSSDVAKAACVSQTTVSRVLNMDSKVKEVTRNKVLNAAMELGYTPNAIARSLTSRKTGIIAIVTISSTNPYFSIITGELSKLFHGAGKQILYFEMDIEQEIDDILYKILQYQVDGVIIISAAVTAKSTDAAIKINVPVVVFNKRSVTPGVHSVCSDNVEAGRMVADFLINKGYTDFSYIGSPTLSSTSSDRLKGFSDRIEEHGYNLCSVAMGDYSYASGGSAMRTIMDGATRPNAVFCANDLMALGALDMARRELSLRIPEDVAIVGFDDIDIASWAGYSLTTVHQPFAEMAADTFQYLTNNIHDNSVCNTLKLFQCHIVERSTT